MRGLTKVDFAAGFREAAFDLDDFFFTRLRVVCRAPNVKLTKRQSKLIHRINFNLELFICMISKDKRYRFVGSVFDVEILFAA